MKTTLRSLLRSKNVTVRFQNGSVEKFAELFTRGTNRATTLVGVRADGTRGIFVAREEVEVLK